MAENENFINRKGIAPNLPVTPTPNVDDYGNPVPDKSAAETWMDALNRTNSGVVQNIPLSSVYIGDRYSETMPGTDYEEGAAQQQHWSSKAANSLGKFGVLTGTTFLQNTVGAVNGLVNWGKTGNVSSFYNNDFNKWVNDLNEGLEDEWANYYTQAERDADWYSPKKILSANFFWDGIIKNLGFSVGTIASGAVFAGGLGALSRAIGMIPKAGKLFSIGKGAQTLAATEEALAAANAGGRAAATYGKMTDLSRKFLGQYKLLSPAQRAVVGGLATSGESSFEAYHNMNEYRDRLIEEYKESNYGIAPKGEDLEKINSQAEDVGNASYMFNAAVLSFTNYVQFPKIFGSSYKVEKGIANGLTSKIKDITKEGGKYVAAPARGGRILSTLNKIRPYTFSASEAFEEGSQYAITKGTQDYFDKKYNNIPNTFLQSVMEGVAETIGTNEGMENVLIGGLSGAIMLGAGRYRDRRNLAKNTDAALREDGRWTGEAGINTAGFSEFTKDTYDSVRRAAYIQQMREGAIEDGNILDSKDLEADYIINYLTPRIKYGRFDLVKEDIEDYKQLASTEEGFAQLQQEGKALETDTREAFMARLNLLEQTADDVKTFYQTLNLRYAGLRNEEGERVYSPEVIDKMVYASAKIADYDKRIPSLSLKLTEVGLSTETILSDLVTGNVESFNEASTKIDSLDITDDQKLDLGQALDDVAEMALRRSKFLKEYSDIKNNPDKYKEETVEDLKEPITQEGDDVPKVRIKTKEGEREYTIGKEFFLGKVVEYDENGHEVYRAPRLTLLGENEDGTIKVQTSNGKIRNISKSEFEDYNLGSVESTLSNRKAKFFMENWNNIFIHRGLKDKKGQPRRGRLEYSNKDNALTFVFKDEKGRVKRSPVLNWQFKAQESYNNPMVESVDTLTATQKEALDNLRKEKTSSKIYNLNTSEGNVEVIQDLHKSIINRQTQLTKLVKRKKERVKSIAEDIAALERIIEKGGEDKRAKRGTRFKPTVRKAIKSAMDLSRERTDLENEIAELENNITDASTMLSYVEDLLKGARDLPTSTKEMIDEIEFEAELLKEGIEETEKQLKGLSAIIAKISDAIDAAVDFVLDLVGDFKKKYPKTPDAIEINEFNEFLEANPNFLKRKPEYINDLRELESFIADVEDTEITSNEKKLAELRDKVNELEKEWESQKDELAFKEVLLKKFKKAYEAYVASGVEAEKIKKNKQLIRDAIGTADKGNVQTKNREDKIYEPDGKKAIEYIWRSTTSPTEGLKPHHERANRFGFNLEKFENRESIRGVFITSDNESLLIPGLLDHLRTDENGNINEEVDKESIIALVMVDENGNLVGENGQPLTEDQLANPLDNAIYQTMPLADLTWKMQGKKGESAFRAGEQSRSEAVKQQYGEYRDRIFESSKQQESLSDLIEQAHTIEASFGHPQYSKKLNENGNPITENGKPVLDYSRRTSVKDAGLITEDDLFTENVIFIPTTNEIVDHKTTRYEGDNLGLPFLKTESGVLPLQNRHHTRKEAETIFDVLVQVAKNMIDPNVGVSHEKTVRLRKWLETVVYWGIPTRPDGTRKSAAYNSVFWEVNDEGDFVLSLSGKGTQFSFDPTSLQQNKNDIISILESMYNNVRNENAKKITEPYEEITGIDNNGEPIVRTWANYQAYLLSDKVMTFDETDKENGKPRSNVPLTTIMTPLETEQDVNRTGIYFYTTDNLNEVDIPEVETKTGLKAGKLGTKSKQKPFVFDGKTHNVIVGSKNRKITFIANPDKTFKLVREETDLSIVGEWVEQGVVSGDQQELQKQVSRKFKDIIQKEVNKQLPEGEKIVEEEAKKEEPESKGGLTDRLRRARKGTKEEAPEQEKPKGGLAERIRKSKGHKGGLYRLAPGKVPPNKFEKEDWPKVEKWLKQNVPNFPVYRVKNIIQATNGRLAWGMFKDGAIYVYENAEVGTVYHEVFEGVWKSFTDPKEQQSVVNEFRQRRGEFVDRPSGETIKYSDATDQQVKEQLAEEFRNYIQYKTIPPKPDKGRPFILKLFADLYNFIKKFISATDADSKVEQMFKDIAEGGYKNRTVPYKNQLSLANRGIIDIADVSADDNSELRVAFTGAMRSQLIDSMVYYTIFELIKNDENLFTFAENKIQRSVLYDKLKNAVIEDLINQTAENVEGLSEQQADIEITRTEDIAATIEEEWDSIVGRYEENLDKYGIEFDENDEIAVSEYEKSREDPYGEANKIDHYKKSNAAIKLLLATTLETDSDGNPSRTSIGSLKLIPTNRIVATLYNKLHNARSVEEMMYKLKELARVDPDYRGLYRRLTKHDYTSGVTKTGDKYIADFSNIKTQHGLRLLSTFYNTFSKQNPEVLTITVFDNGEVGIGNAHLSTQAAQIRRDYIDGIVAKAKKNSKYFKYNKKERAFIGEPNAVKNLKLNNAQSRVNFLNDIGIDLKMSDVNKFDSKLLSDFNQAVDGIRSSIASQKKMFTISGRVLGANKRLMDLAQVEAKVKSDGFDTTFFNVNRDRTQSFIGTNPASNLYDFLSQISKFDETTLQGTQYEYLLKDVFSRGSSVLKRMFRKGKRISSEQSENLLKVAYVSGIDNQQKGKTKQSSKLNYKERLIQELNINLRGYYLNLVPGDASMEWAINMGNPVSESDINSNSVMMMSIFKDYFIDELNLARDSSRNVDRSRRVNGKNPREMRFFKDILDSKLHNELVRDNRDAAQVYEDNKGKIERSIKNYINKNNKELQSALETYNILTQNEEGQYSFENVATEKDIFSKSELNTMLTYLNTNYMIANIELHKLLYSDPYQYSDELKRIKNFNSPRQTLINNSPEMSVAFNRVWNRNFKKDDPGWTNFTQEYFRTAVHDDVLSAVKELTGYNTPFKETDGGGIISLTAYRHFRIRGQDWNDAEERQYQYDMAFEKEQQGKKLTEIEKEILNSRNPGIRSAYTPIKPIVSGNKADGNDYNDIVLDKFALFPLSARLIDNINKIGGKKTSNAQSLYNKMRDEKIDYIVFESSRKVGINNTHANYNSDGSFNTTPYSESVITNIPFSIMSVQSEVPSKDVPPKRGTQVTKLATMDYMSAGVPIDFEFKGDESKRYQAWYKLSEDERMETSPLYKEIVNNQKILEAKIEVGYRSLLTSLGLKEQYSRGKGKYEYVVQDPAEAAEILRKEMLKREINDNISDALRAFERGESIIEATPAYHQIRNILYSIADREVISQKINGGMKVQMHSSFLEEVKAEAIEVNGKEVYVSDTLAFYEEDGVAEIMVGRWFESDLSDEELLNRWYEKNDDSTRSNKLTKEGREILSGIGFRIPTQKQNSIESFVIKQFLPREYGDTVIVPSAIVQKTGSDFDIDKLTVYLKNVISKKDPRVVKLKTNENSTVRDRYADWVLSVVDKDVKNYVKFLSRDSIAKIREKFKPEFDRINERYEDLIESVIDTSYNQLLSNYDQIAEDAIEQDMYVDGLFLRGKAIFASLPDYIKDEFFIMSDYIAENEIKGPAEIVLYMNMAQDMIDDGQFDLSRGILEDLVTIYQQELIALGDKSENIKRSKEQALVTFREAKEGAVEGVRSSINTERADVILSQREELSEFYENEYIDELARIKNLESVEDFEKLPILAQNSKKALENEYIQSLQNLVSHPLNRERLLKPNSAEQLENLSIEVAKATVGSTFNYRNVGNMTNRLFMSRLRHAFVSGKYAIGIAAVNQTNHSLNQRQLIYIDPERKAISPEEDQRWLGDMKIHFDKYNKMHVEGKGDVPVLSMIENAEGQDISEIITQFIDGYVDISKGPWIIELGATPNVVSTWLFLVKTGVPIDTVAYFMNQPIIRDYLKSIENAGYSWLFIDNFVDEMKEEYSSSAQPSTSIPSKTQLSKTMAKSLDTLSDREKAEQQFMLDEFLKYAKMASHMFYVTQGSNFDTANLNDPFLIFKKFKQLEKARQSVINDVDDILKNSFLGKLGDNASRMRNALSEFLISDGRRVRNIIEPILENYTDIGDREFVKVARKVVSDLFDYAVQVDKDLNAHIQDTLINKGGVATELRGFMDNIAKNPSHPLYNNYIVGEKGIMTTELSNRAGYVGSNNIKVKGLGNSTYDQNSIIYAFREIKEYLRGKNKLYNRIVTLAILQSGLSTSSISFTSVLPYEDFVDIYQSTLLKMDSLKELEKFRDLNVFQRNNWDNDNIVPRMRARWTQTGKYNPSMEFLPRNVKNAVSKGVIPNVVQLWDRLSDVQSDHVVYSWEQYNELADKAKRLYPKLSRNEAIKKLKAEMRKVGDYSYINRGLFQKVRDPNTNEPLTTSYKNKMGDEVTQHVYKAINAWGEGRRANEFYDVAKQSVIDNGFIKVEEVSDNKVIDVFNGEKIEKSATEKDTNNKGRVRNAPIGMPETKRPNKRC